MKGLKTVFEKVSSRKMKVFFVFLLCSFFAWTISKLSEEYESKIKFNVTYRNIPDSLLVKKEGAPGIDVKIRAGGFQFLNYSLNTKTIVLNVSEASNQNRSYVIPENKLKTQIEQQLPNSVALLDINSLPYKTNLYQVDTKMVAVKPQLGINLAQNHLLKGELKIEPDSIRLKGPKQLIADIKEISTEIVTLKEVSSDFTKTIPLKKLDFLGEVVIAPKQIEVSGKVVRFSEKEFEVGIRARNVPEGYRLKMFPDHIKLYCKAGISRLKELQADDFNVFVDLNAIEDGKYLYLQERDKPEDVFSVRLLQNRVEFVLEKL